MMRWGWGAAKTDDIFANTNGIKESNTHSVYYGDRPTTYVAWRLR